MKKILTRGFFDRSTLLVARQLLGKYIVRRRGEKEIALMVTEVEAYDGPLDRASHAYRGITPRTEVMFGEPGNFYVYFTYGMHWMLNIVTGPKGYPAAILVRGGIYENQKARTLTLVNGPARLTRLLKINRAQNSKPAAKKTGLWFEDRGTTLGQNRIITAKRIGVDYAGRIWKSKLYNFRWPS